MNTSSLPCNPRYTDVKGTFVRNEFIVKLPNSEIGPSNGRNGKNFRFLFK
jgi:hypothetical protein